MQTATEFFKLFAFIMVFEIALIWYMHYLKPSLQNLHRTLGFAIMGTVATFIFACFNQEAMWKDITTFALAISVTTAFVSFKFIKKIRSENYQKLIA
jgi:chromate transport protein ChrA